MAKFFVPTSWENLAEAIKFKTSKTEVASLNAAPLVKKPSPDVPKVVMKKRRGRPPGKRSLRKRVPRVKEGRVEKTGVRKQKVKQRRKRKITPPSPSPAQPQPSAEGGDGVSIATTTDEAPSSPSGDQPAVRKVKRKRRKRKAKPKSDSESEGEMLQGDATDAASYHEDGAGDASTSGAAVMPVESCGGFKAFEAKLKEKLLGGRFRYLNEQLYTTDSETAEKLFSKDAELFDAYHAGYRQQVEKWPLNPLSRIIKMITRLPKSLEIGDFGCGEGRLAQEVPQRVYSMDLVSTRPDIIACDMARTPLLPQSLDVAVYCLSLMGTNLTDYLLEANRVLRLYGLVIIAEIQSRFEDENQFLHGMESCGFELVKRDASAELFYFFQFKKVRDVGRVARIQPFSLKPCLYRRR